MQWALALLLTTWAELAVDAGASSDARTTGIASSAQAFDARWSRVASPTRGPARAIGLPGAGCVQGAAALPEHGQGWDLVHPERHRQFGHSDLIAYVRRLAKALRREKLPRLFVGDLGQPRGGPTPTGHRSHQSGLDVDLWYAPPSGAFVPGKSSAPEVASLATKKILPAWTRKVARLVEIAASDPAVDRVFVHPAVKRALCADKSMRGDWLSRVRPWYGHQDHFHVRLLCPADSPDCTAAQPLPSGDGCGNALDWWFSDEPAKTAAKRGAPGENAPAMPAQCEQILSR